MTLTPAGLMNRNGTAVQELPDAFCWTKFGSEAGEHPDAILERKEQERSRNDGLFLWGIGNSLRPSLVDLLALYSTPTVCFSPMKSAAAQRDVNPDQLELWDSGIGLDGRRFRVPEHSVVTSRSSGSKANHFALVCRKETAIKNEAGVNAGIDTNQVRNLRTGSTVGSSQVTSVVRRVAEAPAGSSYPVAFTATLEAPYFVVLTVGVSVPRDLHRSVVGNSGSVLDSLAAIRRERFGDEDVLGASLF